MASQPLIIDPGSTIISPPSSALARPRGPLVRAAKVKWERDSAISDLIDYFDEPRFHDKKIKSDADRFALLTVKEIRAIQDIALKCREDFSYAARNFFWITNKKKGDQLFKLWESQELIYEQLLRLKAKGLHMKLMILKARQLGSLLPESRILTDDLRWIKIGDAEIGQKLLSVDEYSFGRIDHRKLREAVVEDKWEVIKEGFEVRFANGTTLVASDDHPFLCDNQWKTVSQLQVGDYVRVATSPWNSQTFEDGWFGGILDAEGHFRRRARGMELSVSQKPGAVLDRARSYLLRNNYTFREDVNHETGVHSLVSSQSHDILRILGQANPIRLKQNHEWIGDGLPTAQDGWAEVINIKSVGHIRMVDIRTSTSTFIAEGLVTHNCSTLIEGLIAWASMFFRNTNAIVVSFDQEHAAYLFGIMQHIFDLSPWWLKPQCSSREYKDGLKFDNPDQDDRRRNPGLNSAVMVQAANKRTGVGQGVRISAAHLSEFADWHPDYARDVIEEDLGNALAEDDPDMFAILESTAKGAGNYSYRLWNKNVELGDQAEWHPLFLPWFFESTRVIAPPRGWRSEAPEIQMNDRVKIDWLRCDSNECQQYQERYSKTHDFEDTTCPTCGVGMLREYSLTPSQMYWMQRKRKNAEKESESLKKLRQEMATTAEEAFQLSGIAIFGDGAQEYVNSTVRPPLKAGFLDKTGKFHGCNPNNPRLNSATNEYYDGCFCEGCDQDHTYGDENGETPFHVWKEPEKDAEYCIGGDVSEGLGGEADYSVGFVLRVDKHGGADEQVATFRSNLIDPVAFAQVLNFIGRAYNEAMMCIELNRYDTCGNWVRFQCQYPNLYRWKHLDSINPLSNKLGWLTTAATKPRLYQTLKRWLQFKLIILYSRNLASEIKTFTKDDYDERGAGSESGSFDDEIIACMIALYCAHESDWDDSLGQMAAKRELTMEEAPWWMSCSGCQLLWPARNAQEKQCPRCKCMVISGRPNRNQAGDNNQADAFYEGQTIDRHEVQEYSVETTRRAVEDPEPDYGSL